MAVILERRFGPPLGEALRGLAAAHPGARLEVWCFEPAAARRAAEAALAAEGVRLRLRAAWKPALHALLEDPPAPGERLELAPPAPADLGPARFVQEPWPAPALFGRALRLAPPVPCAPVAEAAAEWRLRRVGPEGSARETRILAPLRPRPAPGGGPDVLAACGWVRATARDGAILRDGPWQTPLETALAAAFEALGGLAEAEASRPDRDAGPGLDIVLRLEGAFEALEMHGFRDDPSVDLAEILHEELHFAGLEIFARAFGLAPGDRTLRAGRIVPVVVPASGEAGVRLRVTARRQRPAAARTRRAPGAAAGPGERPWTAAEIRAGLGALEGLGGAARRETSLRGRPIEGRVFAGDGAGVLVTAGQHANEPSGPPAALAIAAALAGERAACAVCPMENPDGHALYARLRRLAPRHMHHAARYTALGADLTHLPPQAGERAMRDGLAAELAGAGETAGGGAVLHLSLHGYPAHEWIRPFTGYLPRGFEGWSLPRGMHLILRYRAEAEGRARAALAAAAAALAGDREIAAFNARQLDALALHAPEAAAAQARTGPVGVAASVVADLPVSAMLITEAPDETVEGPGFAMLVRAQVMAGLAAARAWRSTVRTPTGA